jgi:hypothetical protein
MHLTIGGTSELANRSDWTTQKRALAVVSLRHSAGIEIAPLPTFNFVGPLPRKIADPSRLTPDHQLIDLLAPKRALATGAV